MEVKEQTKKMKEMINGYKLTYLIMSANNIGLFNILENKGKTLTQIAMELHLEEDRIEPILNGLTFHKIISKNKDSYYLEEYNDVLNKNSEYNQLGYIQFAETIIKRYENLENAIKNKETATNSFKELTEKDAESFMQGMNANAINPSKFIAENYDFDNHKILDVAAGAGTYSITVAKKYENVTAKMIDLPEMVKIQNKRIHQEGLKDRLTSETYDYNINFPTGNYDDVFLFAVVHQEPEEQVRKLLDNIYHVLKPNGRLFLTSFFLNEDKISPEYSVQFAIEMLINTEKGKAYTHNEIQDLMKKSQFKEIERVDEIPGPATLYIAKKICDTSELAKCAKSNIEIVKEYKREEAVDVLKNYQYKDKNRILITGAVLGSDSSSVETYEKIVLLIDSKYLVSSPLDTMKFEGNDTERYERAMQLLQDTKMIIAEMSNVSTGQGMELQEAVSLNIPILVIAKEGSKISGLVKGCKNVKDIVYYHKIEDIEHQILQFIKEQEL